MATFMSLHKQLNFLGMTFRNGRFSTEDPKQIAILTKSPAAKRYHIVRIDKIEEAIKEEKTAEEAKATDEEVAEKETAVSAPKASPSVRKGASIKKK